MIFEVIFWGSVLALVHSYLLFPLLLSFVSRKKVTNKQLFSYNDTLPYVSILMAVHNEEAVIIEKIKSVYYTLYPLNKFEVLVGSDKSTDGTNRILEVFSNNYKQFQYTGFYSRMGKPSIINYLADNARGEILIITDANVFLELTTVFEIVKHFKNPQIGLVDTRVIHRGNPGKGISVPEAAYIMREVSIKENESLSWGTMMGPFGGCFAIRKELFEPVPENLLVDDFFINMTVLSKGYKAITSPTAFVSEDISVSMKEEYRRKIRIATGNFQNLARFAKFLLPPFSALGFCFFSHKVLRWFGPFFILLALVSNAFLFHVPFYKYVFILQLSIFILPLADFLLKRINIEIIFLRFVTHFLTMNLALFTGFFRNVYGVKSNIWQPTRRNQSE